MQLFIKFLYFLTATLISSGFCTTVVYLVFKKATEKVIDDRIDLKLIPFMEETKKTEALQWTRIDDFKKEVETKYLAKETFKIYNEFGAEALKRIECSVKDLADKFDKYLFKQGD